MKKTLLLAGVAALFAVNANAMELKPYVGLDYVRSDVDIDKIEGYQYFEDGLNAFAVSAGTRFHKNFGLEAFYQQSEEGNKKTGLLEMNDEYKAYGIDAIGYLPLGCEQKFELLGSLGVGYYDVDVKEKVLGIKTDSYSDNGWGYRAGVGAQYNVTDNLAARVMARYVDIENVEGVDNMVDLTAGIRYSF